MRLPSVSALQFAREITPRAVDQFSKPISTDAVPAERNRRLLFEKIGSGNCDRVNFSVLGDQPFDDVIRGMSGI